MRTLRYSIVLVLLLGFLYAPILLAGPHPRITFVSEPVTVAQVGVLYSYTAEAKSSDSSEVVTFKLLYGPDGMTIDSVSGLVQWTPARKGYFPVNILARGDSGNTGHQRYTIRVSGAVGRISGQVIDAGTLLPIQNVLVQIFPGGKHVMGNFSGMPVIMHSAVTDSMGMYSIANIDTGTYFGYATKGWQIMWTRSHGDEYLPVWWQNSPTIAGANPIQVVPDSTLTINFQLVKKVTPHKITVSGVVTDTAGNPLKNALVVISRVKPEPPVVDGSGGQQDSRPGTDIDESQWGRIEDASGTAHTDSNGVYSAQVFTGFTYIASAYARGYIIQFYNGKANVLEADQFAPAGDTTGINFSLTPLPPATSTISGSVQDSTGQGVISRLILFPAQKNHPVKLRTVSTDSTGNFSISQLYDGKYILMAVPYSGYLPAFYKLGAFGTWNWKEADTISLAGQVTGLIVGVVPKSVDGAGVAHGRVRTKDGTGVDGAIVYAAVSSGAIPVNFTVTGSDGSYNLDGLTQDDFILFADKPDYVPTGNTSATINYSTGGTTTVPDLTFDGVTTTEPGSGAASTVPAKLALYQNYPNPFNPSTHIQYDLPHDARVVLRVFNVIGQEVAVLSNENQTAGSHSIEFNASQLPSGIYFYRLQADNTVLTKKMILMK